MFCTSQTGSSLSELEICRPQSLYIYIYIYVYVSVCIYIYIAVHIGNTINYILLMKLLIVVTGLDQH